MTANEFRRQDLKQHHAIKMERALVQLTAIERDLEVLGSKFCPDLHEINAQLHELRGKMDQDRLNDDAEDERNRSRQYYPLPEEGPSSQNGGQETTDPLQDEPMKQDQ